MNATVTDEQIIHDDATRAAYMLGMEHGRTAGHSEGWDACRLRWADRWTQKVAELHEQMEPYVLAEVANRVNGMFKGYEGGHGGHARSVESVRRELVPHAASSPKCDCGDWSKGYFYRDAMARHGGVIEAEAAGLDFGALPAVVLMEQAVSA